MPHHRLTDIVTASMSKTEMTTDDAELEAKLSGVRIADTLRVNGARRVADSAARILDDASRAGKRADRAAAASEKAEQKQVEEAFIDLAQTDETAAAAAADGDAAEKPDKVDVEALEAENRADKQEAKTLRADRRKTDGSKKGRAASNDDDDDAEENDEEEEIEDDEVEEEADRNIDDIEAEAVDDEDEEAGEEINADEEDNDDDDDTPPRDARSQVPSKKPKGSKATKTDKPSIAKRKKNKMTDFIVDDPDEVRAANDAARRPGEPYDANDIDAELMAQAEKKRRRALPASKATAAVVAGNGATDTLRTELDEYFSKSLPKLPETHLAGYLSVVIADYLRGTRSSVRDNNSIYSLLCAATLNGERFDPQQPLLDTTAEALRADVAMVEGILSALRDFVRRADAEAYKLMAYTMLGGVKEINVLAPSGDEEISNEPVVCAVLQKPVHMHATKRVECLGGTAVAGETLPIARIYHISKPLVGLFEALHIMLNFELHVDAIVEGRKASTTMRALIKGKVDMASAVAKLVNEEVNKSALVQTRNKFKKGYDATRGVLNKFTDANKEAAKLARELEEQAQEEAQEDGEDAAGEGDDGAARAENGVHVDEDGDGSDSMAL